MSFLGIIQAFRKQNSNQYNNTFYYQKYTQTYHPPPIYSSILDAIGNTPLVKLNKIPQSFGVKCEFLAKCEFFNAGGSVKDRIGKQMIIDAENQKRIQKGDLLIEPTSGNTGIGLALAAALKGYKMLITLPEKMSQEKVDVLKALGADIIRTPTEASYDSPESHLSVAKKINMETSHSHILDQYSNPSNPNAHYFFTAQELIDQTRDKPIDYIFIAAGTGGTIAGVSKRIKEEYPNCKVIGIDPIGSILAQPDSLNIPAGPYVVEGIGYDFIPDVLDRTYVDSWIKTTDEPSLNMARRLIREEGMLCGGSSGSVLYAAINYAIEHNLSEGVRCVVLLPDSLRNYMTKLLSKDWMIEKNFSSLTEYNNQMPNFKNKDWKKVANDIVTFEPSLTVKQSYEAFNKFNYEQLPVIENGKLIGVVTERILLEQLNHERSPLSLNDLVKPKLSKDYILVNDNATTEQIAKLLQRNPVVFIQTINQDGLITNLQYCNRKSVLDLQINI